MSAPESITPKWGIEGQEYTSCSCPSHQEVKMYEEFDIYYENLNHDTQKRLLEFVGVSSPLDLNWDTFPLFTLPKLEDEDEIRDKLPWEVY